jgi:hypothetical protein
MRAKAKEKFKTNKAYCQLTAAEQRIAKAWSMHSISPFTLQSLLLLTERLWYLFWEIPQAVGAQIA